MCKPGYYGQFCSAPCPSGSFGSECAGFCYPMCSNSTCDHVHGCPENNKTSFRTTISSKSFALLNKRLISLTEFRPQAQNTYCYYLGKA